MARRSTRGALLLSICVFVLFASAVPASAATTGVIDGLGTGGGRIQGRVSGDTASIVRGGIAWVFSGANPEFGYRLRLAKLGSTNTYQTLDGAGGTNGRTTDPVATDVSATTFGGMVHVFYVDSTALTLRHGWLVGSTWHFETLDGNSTVGGRTTNDVGFQSFAIVFQNRLNVFYADATAGDLRRAVFDGTTWTFSVVDGDSILSGRTTAVVGGAIKGGIWGSRLHVLYTQQPDGLREATTNGTTWSYATISSLGNGSLALLKVSETQVHVVYDDGGDVESALWNGALWSVDQPVTGVGRITGLALFLDGSTPFVAAGISECFGSGGCDRLIGVAQWNGTSFDDPYLSGSFSQFGEPPGDPSSAVTIGGVAQLFVGGFGFQSEPDIYDEVLLRVIGPF